MKNVTLNREEINNFKTIWIRIQKAMEEKGIKSVNDLNRMIKQKRGFCPDKSVFSKLKSPEKTEQGYYNISAENLFIIADVLDVSLDYLLTGKEAKNKNSMSVNNLGLSATGISNLLELRHSAESYDSQKIKSTSPYYRNPFNKKLDILNWILEHVDTKTENMDFLTCLYHLVMTRISSYSGGLTEAVFRSVDTYAEEKAYAESVFEVAHPTVYETEERTIHEKKQAKRRLSENRAKYVKKETWNRECRRIFKGYLEDGTVSVSDPVTNDEVLIPLGSPQAALEEQLKKIIKSWQEEYLPIYKEMASKSKEEHRQWLEQEKNKTWNDMKSEDNDEAESLEKYQYEAMTDSQRKLYRLLEYLESHGIEFGHLSEDGTLYLNLEGIDTADISQIMQSAEARGIGIYAVKNGIYAYDEEKAVLN